MRAGDIFIGGAAAVLGAAVFVMTLSFPRMADGAPGPALFPQLLSAMLVGFGAVTILQSRGASAETGEIHELSGIVRGAIILVLIAIYIAVVQRLGFVITGTLLVLALMLLLRVRLLTAALSTVVIVAFCVLLFSKALRVPLQPGILGF
jgi:hypothetical protein